MARITIVKSYALEDGSISGMFKIPKQSATNALRHELIELEGVEAEISLAQAPAPITEPLSLADEGRDLRNRQNDLTMEFSAYIVRVASMEQGAETLHAMTVSEPQLSLGRCAEGEAPDEFPNDIAEVI